MALENPQPYVAIIGDMVGSKQIAAEERYVIQDTYKKVLRQINEEFSSNIVSQFSITLGDEFQGLLYSPEVAVQIVSAIELYLYPAQLRFGIGIGTVSTAIDFLHSTENDGTAYHRARRMIRELEASQSQYTERKANVMLSSGESLSATDKLVNAIFSVCTALKSTWTVRQWEVIRCYFSCGENQYRTAEALGIGQSSVNRALKNAQFYTYYSAMNTVSQFLAGKGEN